MTRQRALVRKVVHLRKNKGGPGGIHFSYNIGVPREIADHLIRAKLERFTVELTDDGMLYRPIFPDGDLPAWLEPEEPR